MAADIDTAGRARISAVSGPGDGRFEWQPIRKSATRSELPADDVVVEGNVGATDAARLSGRLRPNSRTDGCDGLLRPVLDGRLCVARAAVICLTVDGVVLVVRDMQIDGRHP